MTYGGLDDEHGITDEYYGVAIREWVMLEVEDTLEQLEAFHGASLEEVDRLMWTHLAHISRGDGNWKAWEHLSLLALRFVTAAASEAEVERLLSIQKRIQGQNTTNISMEGLTARLQLFGDRGIDRVNE